jgi:type III restriction enzyme
MYRTVGPAHKTLIAELLRNRVAVGWNSIASVPVDPMKVPDEVELKTTLLNRGHPSLLEPGGMAKLDLEMWRREATLQQREFEMAAALIRHYSEQDKCEAPAQVLFPQMLEIVKRFVRDRVVVDDETKRVDVFLSPYWGYAIERLTEAIHPAVSDDEDAEIPRYEQRRGVGSTADVDFWTVKKVKEIEHSHLNYVVQDSKWESSAAYYLDHSPHVVSFVKNQGLGFAIPYLHAGGDHEYFPDFLVKLTNGVTLILETKGHDKLEGVKRQAAERWVRAVNADGSHGEWRYELVHNMNEIPVIIDCIADCASPILSD